MGGKESGTFYKQRANKIQPKRILQMKTYTINFEEFQENPKVESVHTNFRASRYAFVAYVGDHSISFSLN